VVSCGITLFYWKAGMMGRGRVGDTEGTGTDHEHIASTLARCEARLDAGQSPELGREGFWKAVAAVKGDQAMVAEFGERIATIDQRSFVGSVLVAVGIVPGTVVMLVATVLGLGVVAWGYRLDAPWNGVALIAGTLVLLVSTHGLAHLVVGRLQGMRFTHWFIASLTRPQPGVKVDYRSYLSVPALSRAWMHAAGAITTKLIPFLMLGAAAAMDAPGWTFATLVGLGILQIFTDINFSVKGSDWKKFKRERALAG
jgi:hypothetical protein